MVRFGVMGYGHFTLHLSKSVGWASTDLEMNLTIMHKAKQHRLDFVNEGILVATVNSRMLTELGTSLGCMTVCIFLCSLTSYRGNHAGMIRNRATCGWKYLHGAQHKWYNEGSGPPNDRHSTPNGTSTAPPLTQCPFPPLCDRYWTLHARPTWKWTAKCPMPSRSCKPPQFSEYLI